MTTEVEDVNLAYLAANAFATHQAEGELALACDSVVGSGFTDEHALMLPEHQEKTGPDLRFWDNKTTSGLIHYGYVH
ncbi:MAG: hypothetical protein JNM42_14250 [Propionivibrio sp.]|uniref:hypothetical protein n=1 Tax=Propionivibrio sp. TaxID=2212460 RepID=UPI001A3C7A2D|nr:hypothetical protein [Propionivibrio sp.]MBL8415597.1 hypothetical protein [Propionivibrio sp.]